MHATDTHYSVVPQFDYIIFAQMLLIINTPYLT
jgi:hypothetical protein